MTLHKADQRLWCHHCGQNRPIPEVCPECGSTELRPLGQGTERLEEFLGSRFAGYGIARIDRDSTRRKGLLEQRLAEIRQGKYRLLLGTQMLAKGHHFPEVTLACILGIDQGLFGVDYRATERLAQLIVQVAGRAGRADKPGRVLIQTRYPEHPLLQILLQEGYGAFAEAALQERREARLPPFSHQALLRAEASNDAAPRAFLEAARDSAQRLTRSQVEMWGPVPAPMERRAGRSRAQLLVQSDQRDALQRLLAAWVPALAELPQARRVRWSVDVDPQETY
jgi:primosomal protein N' (replication factor Y)